MNDKPKVRILDLESWGKHGWWWIEEYFDGDSVECRTNGDGEGLWYLDKSQDWKQVRGTSQFNLPSDRTAARKKIWREAMDQIAAKYGG